MTKMQLNPKTIGVGLVVFVVIIVIIVFIIMMLIKFFPNSGTFSGFAAYKNIDSYLNVDPFINFYKQNSILTDEWYNGSITIDKVSYVYMAFLKLVKEGKVNNAPTKIVEEIKYVASFIATGQEFDTPSTVAFKELGQAIVNINRLCILYLEGLKFSKDKLGGSDPGASKLYDDYQKVEAAEDGYVKQFLVNAQVEHWASNDSQAKQFQQDLAEDLVISSALNNTDPREQMNMEHGYQQYWDDMHSNGKYKSAQGVYDAIDKRFPGTFDRKILSDESVVDYDPNPKNPNVPRPGILGHTPDQPYTNDPYINNFYRA
jgi:hypothetical protein